MSQDQFYRTTIQILRQLRIPFVDPCDTNYTGDCICGSTGPVLNGLFSVDNNDLPIGLYSFRVPDALTVIGGTGVSEFTFSQFSNWTVFSDNVLIDGHGAFRFESGTTMEFQSNQIDMLSEFTNIEVEDALSITSPNIRLNGVASPPQTPTQETLPSGTYLRVVDQDGELAGTNGWLGISDLGGAGGIFDAANEGGTIAVENILQGETLLWDGEGQALTFNAMGNFEVNTNGNSIFGLTAYDDGMSMRYSCSSDDYDANTLLVASPEEGVTMTQSSNSTDKLSTFDVTQYGITFRTNEIGAGKQSSVRIAEAGGDIEISTHDSQTIKVGSNTYFERGEGYAKMVGDEQRGIEINNEEEYIELYNTSTKISIVPNEVLLSTPNSNILLTNSQARLDDNSSLKRGFQLNNFGENPATVIGGDFSTLAPNSLVPKAYVDAQRPYKVYTALLSQSGTDDPTAIVLENTLGGLPVTFGFEDVGTFTVNHVSFEVGKTWVVFQNPYFDANEVETRAYVPYNGTVFLKTMEAGAPAGDFLGDFPASLEIRVYN